MTTPELDIHDMVRQLTEQHWHREAYPDDPDKDAPQGFYGSQAPALITQLVGASPAGSGEMSGSAASSRPAARIEALDTLMLIDFEAGDWLYRLGARAPSDTRARILRLHGLHPSTETCGRPEHSKRKGGDWCCQRGWLENTVRLWWQQARIITGWDTAAFRPRGASCPNCEAPKSLRVKVDGALCIECRTVWDADQVGLLGEHVRVEREERERDLAALETDQAS